MTNHIYTQYIKFPKTEMILGSHNDQICICDFRYRKMRTAIDKRIQNALSAEFIDQNNDILELTKIQLTEYFAGQRTHFSLPLLTIGTEFQKKVWRYLQKITYSTTASYLELANKTGNENAVRAVANANGANALAIIIPCHRVIASDGSLGGYAGGVPLKRYLLNLEKDT